MAKYSNTIEYNLKTTLDAKGINQLQSQLASIRAQLENSPELGERLDAQQAIMNIRKVSGALKESFNGSLNMIDLDKFQKKLGGLSLNQLQKDFSLAGATGEQAFNNMLGTLGKMNTGLNKMSSAADKVFNTIGNTVRWGVVAGIWERTVNSIERAGQYVKDLDQSLNDIRIVSGSSAEEMRNFALEANKAAQSLGQTTTAYTNASLIYLQQGLDQETSNQLADITLRTANVTGQDTVQTSEQITAIMNGYKIAADDMESTMDSLALVAADSAADLEELATAESRVASMASSAGVSQEQLAAQIATVVSVTREAPESVGTALRTLYARMSDLKLGETLEDDVSLGTVSSTLEDVGVQVLDTEGNMRELGDIMEDLMGVWGNLSQAQQQAVGQQLAGKRQVNNLYALMNNTEMYTRYLNDAQNAEGTLAEQQGVYMDSLASKMNSLQAAGEGLISTVFNQDDIKPMIDGLTDLVNLITDFVDSIGGSVPLLTMIASLSGKIFDRNIAANINSVILSREKNRTANNNANISRELFAHGAGEIYENSAAYKFASDTLPLQQNMTTQQMEQYNAYLENTIQIENKLSVANAELIESENELNSIVKKIGDDSLETAVKSFINIDNAVDRSDASIKDIANSFRDLYGTLSSLGLKNMEADFQDVLSRLEMAPRLTDELRSEITKSLGAVSQEISTRTDEEAIAFAERNKAAGTVKGLRAGKESQQSANEGFTKEIVNQGQIQSVINLASAIGDLAFAWQGFQALGSLWTNDDLSTGEKVQQTIMNLLMTVPQLAMAFADMKEIVSTTSFGDLVGTLSNYSKEAFASAKANLSFSAAGTAAAASSAAMGTASKLASGGIELLSNALNTLTGPIGIAITLGTMLASTLISASEAAREASLDSGMKQYEDAQTTASLDFSGFDAAYDEYKRTGNVSDELKTSSKQLAESLGVVGAQALINADNFGELADKINEAKEASQTEANQAAENQLNAISSDTSSYNLFQDDFQHAIYGDSEFQSRTGISQDGWGNDTSGMDAVEKLGAMNQALEESNAKMEELREQQKQFDEGSVDFEALQRQIDEEQEIYDRISSLAGQYNFDDVAQITQEQAKAAENVLNPEDFAEMSLDEIRSALTDRSGEYSAIADYYATLGDEAGKSYVDSLIAAISSSDSTIALQYAQENFGNRLNQKFSDTNPEDVEGLSNFYNNLESSGVDVSSLTDEQISAINDAMTQSVIDQVNNSSLSDEDKATLMNNIDWSQPIGDILAQISQAVDTGDINGAVMGNPEDFMDDERDARLKSYNLDEGTIDTYRDIQEQITDLGSREDELTERSNKAAEAAKEVADAYGETSKEYKEAAKAADDAQSTLEAYNDTQEDLVDMSLQSQKGMEALSESIEDNAKILREGDTDSLEYAEAMDDTRQAVADLVNVSKDDISPQFVTDNLDLIEQAAYGDVDAIQQLRIAAADEILVNINKQGNLTPESLDYLRQKATELATMTIEPYAAIDDANFIAQLNNMMANGEMTADQVQSYLNSIGYDPVMGTETIDYTAFTIPGKSIPINVLGFDVGKIDIPDIEIQGKTQMPKIESVQSIGSGRYTPVSSTAKRNRPKGSGGGGGGGGGGRGSRGGGGGGGSSYTPKTKEGVEGEVDRYEKVNTQLSKVGNQFDRIADAQERLSGKQLVSNMNKQIELLNKQIALQKNKLEIQKQEAKEVRDELAAQGVTFDNEGYISNYAQRYTALLNDLNHTIDQYNHTTDEAGQEALEKTIEQKQKVFEDFQDNIKRYDKLWGDEIESTNSEIESLKDSIEDLKIEAFNTTIEAVENLKDLREALNEVNNLFGHGFGTDNANRSASLNIANLQQQAMFLDMNQTKMNEILDQYNQFMKKGSSSIFGENSAELFESMNDIAENAKDTLDAIDDGIKDLIGDIEDKLDEIGDEIDNRYEQFEQIGDTLDTYSSIIELTNGENAYDKLNQASAAMIANNKAMINELKTSIDMYSQLQKNFEDGYNKYNNLRMQQAAYQIGSDEWNRIESQLALYKDDADHWQQVQEAITDKQSELQDKTTDTLEKIQDIYEKTVSRDLNNFTRSLGLTTGDIDTFADQWELIKDDSELYLDNLNRSAEITKLMNKYTKLLNDTTDPTIQDKISAAKATEYDLMSGIVYMTQEDVDLANKRLEILQKEIALQEAQQNKSRLQLRRDTQGNYSYVYEADEEAIDSAEADLLEARQDYWNSAKDYRVNAQDEYLSRMQDYTSTLEDLQLRIQQATGKEREELEQYAAQVHDSMMKYYEFAKEQAAKSDEYLADSYVSLVDMLAEDNRDLLDDVYNQVKDGTVSALDTVDDRLFSSLSTIMANSDAAKSKTSELFNAMVEDANNYKDAIDNLGEQVGLDFDNMSDAIANAANQTYNLALNTETFFNVIAENMNLIGSWQNSLSQLQSQYDAMSEKMKAYQDTYNKILNVLGKKTLEDAGISLVDNGTPKIINNSTAGSVYNVVVPVYKSNYGGGGSGGSGGGSGGSGRGSGGSGRGSGYSSKRFDGDINKIKDKGALWDKLTSWVFPTHIDNYQRMGITPGFATGGYTGTWSDNQNGRLAILHQKELILNATDTENILAAVDAVRKLTTNYRNGAFEDTVSLLNKYGSELLANNATENNISQEITVNATFPNANNAEEIRSAILGLAEQATQYANKNNK